MGKLRHRGAYIPKSHSHEGLQLRLCKGPPDGGRASRSQPWGGPRTRFVCSSCSASSSTACECFCLISWIWASWVFASSSRVFFRMFTSCSRLDLDRETPSGGRPGIQERGCPGALLWQQRAPGKGHWPPQAAFCPLASLHGHPSYSPGSQTHFIYVFIFLMYRRPFM